MSKQAICINLEKSLIIKIDHLRGEIPRSRVVERALNEKYCDELPEKELGILP